MGLLGEIVGHAQHVELLRSSLRSGAPAEAYLISGLPGVGKKTLALAFAAALNCEESEDDACGECVSCRKAASFNHPDTRLFEPDGAVFRVDQMREIRLDLDSRGIRPRPRAVFRVDQVREIRRLLNFQPLEGRRKAFVLTDVETMRAEAANAFLKSLEEPPGAATIILTTSNINALLPTILSRCQILKLLPSPVEELAAALEARGAEAEKALQLARQSGGRPGRALAALERRSIESADAELKALLEAGELDAFRLAEEWQKRPEKLEEWQKRPEKLEALMASLRAALRYRVGLGREGVTPASAAFAQRETARSIQRKMRAVMEAQRRLERNLNGALTMETLAFELLSTRRKRAER